jgi:hypothetical protein
VSVININNGQQLNQVLSKAKTMALKCPIYWRQSIKRMDLQLLMEEEYAGKWLPAVELQAS